MLGHFLVMPIVFCLDMELLGEEKQRTVGIIRKYLDYQVIVHYDNLTAGKMEDFFSVEHGDFPLILLFNYDNSAVELKRPTGYKFLNLVYLTNPFDFEEFSSRRFSLKYEDVVLFVVKDFDEKPSAESNYQLKSVWMQKGLDSSGCVILYNIDKGDFYYVRFYFGRMTGVLNKIRVGKNNGNESIPDLLDYVDEFTNFNGHVFYVAYYPYAPFIWCERETFDVRTYGLDKRQEPEPKRGSARTHNFSIRPPPKSHFTLATNPGQGTTLNQKQITRSELSGGNESEIVDGPGCNVKGIEGNMLLLLSKYLNFTFVMKHAQVQTEDSIWKDMIEDGALFSLFSRLVKERANCLKDFSVVIITEPKVDKEIEWKLLPRRPSTGRREIVLVKAVAVCAPTKIQNRWSLKPQQKSECTCKWQRMLQLRRPPTGSREIVLVRAVAVHFGRRDWAVGGMSTSSERMQLVDFTAMLHMESYTTFYITPEIVPFSWDSALRPFKFNTWIQLFIDIVCIGFIIKLMAVVYKISKFLHFKDSVTIPFYIILEQSILPNLRIRVFNLKLILSVWFLMAIIITTAYKSKLASTMIKPVKREPSSVLELYDEGYTFQVNNEDWSVLEENLAHSFDQRYVNILDRCRNDLKFCEAVAATLKRRAAIIDEDTALQYIILTTCPNYTPFEMSRFRLVKDYLFPSVHAWPLRYGAPYKYRFSITLQRLVDSGIIEYWYKSIISKPIRRSNTYHDGSTGQTGVMDVTGFYGPLSILFAGELLGTSPLQIESVLERKRGEEERTTTVSLLSFKLKGKSPGFSYLNGLVSSPERKESREKETGEIRSRRKERRKLRNPTTLS
ncbi:hypothetical protein Trydic_g13661 [Trypoxylus dichotomus]